MGYVVKVFTVGAVVEMHAVHLAWIVWPLAADPTVPPVQLKTSFNVKVVEAPERLPPDKSNC